MMRPGNDTAPLQRLLASDQEDSLVDDVVDALPVGVIVLDSEGRVVRYNHQEQIISRRRRESVIGKSFFHEVAPCTRTSELAPAFYEYVAHGGVLEVDLAFTFPFPHLPVPRDVRLRLRGFTSRGARFAFLLVEDVTAELQGQRLRELLATLVAHDMKNPLTAMRLNVDMVLRDLTSTRARERLGEARLAADRLDRMIRLFLDVYRLESAELVLTPASFDAQALVQEACRGQGPIVEVNGITLEQTTEPCQIVSDGELLTRIIDNLLDNAIRHARSRVRVRLAKEDGGGACLTVEDDGAGVPDEAKARVFDKLATMTSDARGYNQGLGLTFCALAAARLSGTIDVLDAAPTGAIFRLRLPSTAPSP